MLPTASCLSKHLKLIQIECNICVWKKTTFLSPTTFQKTFITLDPETYPSIALKIARASSSLCRSVSFSAW